MNHKSFVQALMTMNALASLNDDAQENFKKRASDKKTARKLLKDVTQKKINKYNTGERKFRRKLNSDRYRTQWQVRNFPKSGKTLKNVGSSTSQFKTLEKEKRDYKSEKVKQQKADALRLMSMKPKPKKNYEKLYKKCRKQLKTCKSQPKARPKSANPLGAWRTFLNQYRAENPGISYRQAQKQASVLYKQR